MRFRPCLRAVDSTLRSVAKSCAPCSERNPPEIFIRSFIIRKSCSAWLFVNGTLSSLRNRNTDSRLALSRNARFCPGRRFLRPRRPGLAGRNGSNPS